MLINGECYTFPLPRFASTFITDWSPYGDGVFEQIMWSPAAIRQWHHRNRRYLWSRRWFGWVERLPFRLPRWIDTEDDHGEIHRELWWFRVGPLLLNGLTGRPGPPGAHLVANNLFEQLVLGGCEAVTVVGNASVQRFEFPVEPEPEDPDRIPPDDLYTCMECGGLGFVVRYDEDPEQPYADECTNCINGKDYSL